MSGAVVAPLLLDGLRSFARTKWSTTVSMTLLALGLAATMVALSLLEGVLLRPLPFHRPDQLVRIYESNAGMYDRFSVAAGKYVIWERELRAFSKMAMFKEQSAQSDRAQDAREIAR
ncbi:MAG: hypothetical protein IPO08_05195 [Xanthomonadales bacterium]|nr:hypothetical protein [Xanthomonadales bacterium]